jgi:hypothetical protein
MSSCVIKRNKEGKITRVLTPSGEVSTLFDKIAGIAAVSDLDKAAEAYMTAYNDKFRSKFGDWVSNAKREGLRSSLRFRTSSQLFEEYPTWLSGQTTSTGQHSTQITSTVNTYKKIGDFISNEGLEGKSVLDASSGLGVGTQALRDMGMDVDDVEPYPSSKRIPPTYSRYEDIDKKYDYIISNAVLNVIPDDWRSDVLKSMADKLKVGGKLFINVRDAKGVSAQKQKIELDDPSEILVTDSKGNIRAYQKGFTRSSLKEYVERELGGMFEVETANPGNSGMASGMTAVVVTRKRPGDLRFRGVSEVKAGMSEKVSGLAKLGTTVNIVSIDDIRSEVSDHDYADMMSKSKGWYDTDTDTITIVADNIEDEQDLERTILHEVVAHKGLRDLLGNRFDDTMRKIFDSMDEADQRSYLDRYGDQVIAAEEFMATLAESNPNSSLWDKIISFVRDALRSMGLDIKMNDTDMRTLLTRSRDRLSEVDKELSKPMNQINNLLAYDSGEPMLFFRSDDGKIHDSYANVIKGSSGGRIEAGFLAGSVEESDVPSGTADISFGSSSITLNNSESFIPVLGISSGSNISTRGGFVNYLIKKGLLSGERIRLGDRYYLTGAGNSDGLKIYNAMDALSRLRNRFGSMSSEMNVLGSIGFDTEVNNDLDLITTSGEKVTVSRSEIKGMLRQGKFEELNNKYDGFMELALSLMMEDNALYGSNVRGVIENEKAEDLQNRTDITNILSTLGIRVMGMSEYMDKYKMRNGVEPSARALSDMANGVIALAEGATVEDLNEEVAHFLIDTYRNQQEIDEVLDSVVGTPLWNQFAGRYYEVYGKEYQGEELDRMVKREILGKTLAQRFVPGMEQAVEDLASSEDAQLSLFGRIIRAIRNFFSTQRSDLNKVLDRIKESALADDPSAFDVLLLKDSDHLMYSLSDVDVANKLIKNGRSLERLYTRLQRMRSSQSQRIGESISLLRDIGEKVRQVGGELNKNNNLLSTKSVIATAKAEVEYLVTVASSLRKSGKGLDYETMQVIDNVYGEIVPLVRNLRGFVNNQAADYYGSNKVGMVEDMDDILRMAETSMSDINALKSDRNEDWLDGQLRMFNIPERYWNGIKKLINNIHKDINVMSRFFGTLEHSGNAILGMLGQRLAKAHNEAHIEGISNINKMTRMMKERGWGIKDNEDLIQKINGKNSDYLDSSRDFAKYDLLYRTEQAKAIIDIYDLKNVTGKTEKQLIDLLLSDRGLKVKTRDDIVGYDGDKPITKEVYHIFKPTIQNFDISDMTFEDQQRYLDTINKWLDENREKPMVQAYYDKIEKVNKKVEERLGRRVSQATSDFMTRIRRSRYVAMDKFVRNGKVDWKAFQSDPIAWRSYLDILRDRAIAKSEWYSDGTPKEEGSEALMMSEEIKAWDEAWSEEFGNTNEGRKASAEFKEILRGIERSEGGKAAFEFLLAGGHLGFSKDMWGSEEGDYYENLVDKITEQSVSSSRIEKVEEAMATINEINDQLRPLLIQYRDSTRYGEYDFDRLRGSASLRKINELYDRLAEAKSVINAAAYAEDIEMDMPDTVESGVTDSYRNALRDAMAYDNGMDEIKFAKEHMSARFRSQVERMASKLSRKNPSWTTVEVAFFRKKYGLDFNNKLANDIAMGKANSILIEYARTRLYPYMRKYSPKGYSGFVRKINNGTYKVSEFFDAMENGISKEESVSRFGFDINMIDLSINNQWLEEADAESSFRNPNYNPDLGYGYHTPRFDKYKNEAFFKKYGITNEGEEATINKDKWEMRKELLNISRKAMEDYDERFRNIYQIPQISKGGVERMVQAGVDPKAAIGNAVRDIVGERVDDPIHGQGQDLGGIDENDNKYRMIPKYYLSKLENANDVSHDFAYSYSMLSLQATAYKYKRVALDDVMGYRNMMLETQYDGGKNPEATHAYRMFQDWVNASIYDVRINNKRAEWNIGNYKVDLNKLALMFTKFVSKSNLGFSPFVAATGALTGQANFLLEGMVGQYISKDSMKYAYGEAQKQLSTYVSEIGDINRTNKLYVVGEALGVFNVRNRVRSAAYNKIWRTLFRDLPFKMMEVLNSPLDPQVIISVMDDTRLYEGQFWSYSNFKEMMMKDRNMSANEAKRDWERLRDYSMWNMVDVKDGKIVAKNEANKDIIDRYIPTLSSRVRSMVQICDGALNEQNRVGASRNAILNMVLPHRGWFILAVQRAYKKAGFNFQTNQFEEGYMRTLWRFAGDIYNMMSEGRMREIHDVLKEYHSLNPYEQTNIKRSLVNMAVFATMIAIGRALMGYREDNEDSWFGQFITYIGFRTINEIASQTSPFMELNAIDMLQDPLVTARKLGDLTDPRNWDPFATVQTGVYKGESKLWRQLMKFSFGKQWYNIKTARDIKQTSDYWLMTNGMTMGFFLGGRNKDESGEDANWYFDRGR